ncbi:RadC family protein [Clostridium aminobutyricum]|uniref:DNA repair protein RadC n=1 Tax=Clostridium aminobutyricum TaxID=33953 RepID=A0A939D7C2_CLOAM|nr:DNA repair protein RadC [Clostridium aminobutyricum]MBN7772774.1 DNA repair protein RadC [Clostridium aminobutyricum]
MIIRELPPDERPREKLMLYGIGALSNAELLAILIRTGTNKKSALILANEILSYDKNGVAFLADCVPEELSQIQGIGKAKACQIIAAIELGKRISNKPKASKIQINNPEIIANLFMEEMRYYKKEFFNVVLLNTKGEILSVENAAIGDLNSTIVHPREIFCNAVRKSAAAVVFVHNHPSGNPTPSKEDIDITHRLLRAGEILGIQVWDHIIIGDGTFFSLKNRGFM